MTVLGQGGPGNSPDPDTNAPVSQNFDSWNEPDSSSVTRRTTDGFRSPEQTAAILAIIALIIYGLLPLFQTDKNEAPEPERAKQVQEETQLDDRLQ